jgi:hypothetical protein
MPMNLRFDPASARQEPSQWFHECVVRLTESALPTNINTHGSAPGPAVSSSASRVAGLVARHGKTEELVVHYLTGP